MHGQASLMLTREPFDPFKFLEHTLRLDVYYSKRGTHIVLDGLAVFPEEKLQQARNVVWAYPRLLELQLDVQNASLDRLSGS